MALPQFVPRQFEQILQDMVNFIRTVAPQLTDFNVGSLIRSILESAAMEDDEQYNQMVNLLLLWNLDNTRGRDLEERLAEWNVFRLSATAAAGEVIISNSNLSHYYLKTPIAIGATSLIFYSTEGFPDSGYPYNFRIGEGTTTVEDVQVSNNNKTTGVLTLLVGTVSVHLENERGAVITGASQVAPAGTRVRIRPNPLSPEITATLIEDAVIYPGNYDSQQVLAIADISGVLGNVARGSFEGFVGSVPFDGALVRNDSRFYGGTDEESDDQFRDRGRKKIQSLAKSTPLALQHLVIGAEHLEINGRRWRVLSSQIREYFGEGGKDKVDLYIWPGAFDFVKTGQISVPEILTPSAEDGQRFFQLTYYAIVPSSLILQLLPFGSLTWQTLKLNTDYFFNEGTGQLRIADPGLNAGDQLRAFQYTYYTELIQKIQTIVNGVIRNPLEYPGLRPVGVKVLVTYPRPFKINPIRLSIQVKDGFTETDIAPLVRNAINRYLTELKVGDDLILAELVERAMAVKGMYDVQYQYPTSNIIIPEDGILDLEDLSIIVS